MFKTMGRLLLLALVVLAVALLWRAFGPGSAERYGSLRGGPQPGQKPEIKGPDDEEFLWNIEKNRFKERRAREEAERREAERRELERRRSEAEDERKRRDDEQRDDI